MMLENDVDWREASSEMVRAVRGKRSQVAFSRRLGYRSNVAAEWEGGRRAPTVQAFLDAMQRVGIDVSAGMHAFHPDASAALDEGPAAWLRALAGQTRQAQVASRAGFSRHQIRRWFSGEAQPRLPDLLRLIHALTGRAPDWVACFVPIDAVPSLEATHRSSRVAARLAYDHPWSTAVRMLVDTEGYRRDPTDAFLVRALGLGAEQVSSAVSALLTAGLVVRDGERLVAGQAFTSDARASAEDARRLKQHWAQVAVDRLDAPRSGDLTSINLVAVSREDLERVRQLQRAYFRSLRGLVAASEPSEVAALVVMQVVSLSPDDLSASGDT